MPVDLGSNPGRFYSSIRATPLRPKPAGSWLPDNGRTAAREAHLTEQGLGFLPMVHDAAFGPAIPFPDQVGEHSHLRPFETTFSRGPWRRVIVWAFRFCCFIRFHVFPGHGSSYRDPPPAARRLLSSDIRPVGRDSVAPCNVRSMTASPAVARPASDLGVLAVKNIFAYFFARTAFVLPPMSNWRHEN